MRYLSHSFFKVFCSLFLIVFSLDGLAQTCNDRVLSTKPASHFEMPGIDNDLSLDEVKDTKTQLIWKRCTQGKSWIDSGCTGTAATHTWSEALALGVEGWRLPNMNELSSLVETACYNPAIDSTVFPNTVGGIYWSSSPGATTTRSAWYIDFTFGDEGLFKGGNTMEDSHHMNHEGYVRLVRDAE